LEVEEPVVLVIKVDLIQVLHTQELVLILQVEEDMVVLMALLMQVVLVLELGLIKRQLLED
jgi:hypothetical protein